MKKTRSPLTVLLVALVLSSCTKHVFTAPNAQAAMAQHKTMAILPAIISMESKSTYTSLDTARVNLTERKDAYVYQEAGQTVLLPKLMRYGIDVQSTQKTNALLSQAGIGLKDLKNKEPAELAKVLGVDAVLFNTVFLPIPMSEEEALARIYFFWTAGNSNRLNFTTRLFDSDGKMLWQFSRPLSGVALSNAQQLAQRMMNKIGRRIPYGK